MNAFNPPLPQLPKRPADAHKGLFGTVLVVGGSRGMSGAVALAGMAALRGGAGLVRLAVPEPILDTVAGFEPSYMTAPLPADSQGRIDEQAVERILDLAQTATVLALGPGIGRSEGLTRLVGRLYCECPKPMVIDADGLNALSAKREILPKPGAPRVLTPHPGEFARLIDAKQDDAERRTAAVDLASRGGVVVVLKGHRTLITDGTHTATNTTGNPGLATGGTGDVLTGLITALACQGLSLYDAARLGVHVHGLAGDLAVERFGEVAMIASDLISVLPTAFRAAGRRDK